MRALIFLPVFAALGAGCASEPKKYLTSEYDDDKTCRSYMKNKLDPRDNTTYEDCRKSLVDFANNPPAAPIIPSNVTIIVNR